VVEGEQPDTVEMKLEEVGSELPEEGLMADPQNQSEDINESVGAEEPVAIRAQLVAPVQRHMTLVSKDKVEEPSETPHG